MAVTTTTDVIIPEVWGDIAQTEFLNNSVLIGSPAVVANNTLEGAPGQTIHFPKWGRIGKLDQIAETDRLVPKKLSQTAGEATVREAGAAVEYTDASDLYGLGDPNSVIRQQFAEEAAAVVDASLVTEAVSAGALSVAVSGALTWDAIVDAVAALGDSWNPTQFAGLYVNAKHFAQLRKDELFIAANNTANGNTLIRTGEVGTLAGLQVFQSGGVADAKPFIAKRGSLAVIYKRRPLIEQDRDILARTNVLTVNVHYAVKRLDDRGVVRLDVTA